LIVNRKKAGDVSLLLDIKLGRLSYEEVHTMVNELFSEAEYVLRNECILPDRIDYDFVNSLCEEIVEKSGILR
jgi:hypothetical protein